jgi:hypothetical protein
MGANAQTAVPTFTAGQVLTAAQMNESARTGVPVFATTGTRDAAFGGTGEKTLAEGQMCYVEGTGFQTYNGTAWVTWGASPSGGLDLISATAIGSAVSSVTVSSAFSSTYDSYKILVVPGTASAGVALRLTLGATSTGYYWSYTGRSFANSAAGSASANGSSFELANTTTTAFAASCELLGPNLAKNTVFYGNYIDPSTTGAAGIIYGFLNDTTAYTAFTITTSSGTITGGTIRVYGYKN